MELALGQFNRSGAITCWANICPLFKGTSGCDWVLAVVSVVCWLFWGFVVVVVVLCVGGMGVGVLMLGNICPLFNGTSGCGWVLAVVSVVCLLLWVGVFCVGVGVLRDGDRGEGRGSYAGPTSVLALQVPVDVVVC